MKLPFPFLKSKKEESDYYLGLILTDEKAGAVILKSEEGTLKKINSHEAPFSESLEDLSIDNLITVVDKAISRAEEILPPHIQTHQTVFGVKGIWVDSETKKIKHEYLEKLKKVCNALDLTPIGFMETTEAITHLMQDEEGAPVSAIFAEIEKKEITLSLLRGGKVVESVSSPHLESAPTTVDKLLTHFTVPVLPARIVIFQSKANEHTHHAFMAHHWSKELPFLHMPQVTVLPESFDVRSIMYGAASQMGFKVIEEKHDALRPVSHKIVEEEIAQAQEDEPVLSDNLAAVGEEALGDLNKSEQEESDEADSGDFGFVVDQDIAERKPRDELNEDFVSTHHQLHETSDEYTEESGNDLADPGNEQRSGPTAMLGKLSLLKSIKIPSVSGLLTKFSGKKSPAKIIIPAVIVIILIVGIIFFYYYKMQANVILTLKPNEVSQDEKVTFSTAQPSDFSNNLIAAKSVSTSVNGQATTQATGKKDVGDKAKGTVTIFNNSSSSVSLDSGTTLTASNGQVFTLDSSVSVASASGDIFSGTKPGTTDTNVTAQNIGTDGNVPSGTTFSIGSGNSVAAKNDNAFSGGTKKTVTVVSANDLATIRSKLVASVQDNAKQKLSQLASSDETILPILSDPTLENQQFDHHVNDQANEVTLTADVVYGGMAFAKSDLDQFAATIAKQKYPQDSNIANNSIKESLNDVSQRTNAAATATVSIQAGLLPNINKDDIVSTIQHKSLSDAKNSLSGLPQVDSADIKFSPAIPFLPLLFPTLPKTINVTFSTQ
jgi:hypothetical protein